MTSKQHYEESSYREKLIEHLFIGELLKISWLDKSLLEIAKPDVDSKGYDLIAEKDDVVRHIQLKSSFVNSKTSIQKIHVALSKKASGCVVWIFFDQESLNIKYFGYLGEKAGDRLIISAKWKTAKHAKGNAQGEKKNRENIRVIPKGDFLKIEKVSDIYDLLFNNKSKVQGKLFSQKNHR